MNDRDADELHLRRAIELARQAREHGNHPFGALLADEGGRVLLEAENTVHTARDATGHAETNLVRLATAQFDADILERCTLYTSTEPCAMCAAAIFWANIRRVVFALSQEEIHELTEGDPRNFQLELSCREVFARGDHDVEVSGPHFPAEARAVHDGFW